MPQKMKEPQKSKIVKQTLNLLISSVYITSDYQDLATVS